MKLRILTIVMAIALVCGLAACGGTPTTPAVAPATDAKGATEPAKELAAYQIDYILLSNTPSEEALKIEAAINAIITPAINATVKFKMVDWASWDEKANVAVQAGEKADIMFTADWYNYMRSISQGMFNKLNDPAGANGDLLNTYAPQAVAALGEGFVKGTQVDGINYGVPTNKELTVPQGYAYNKTLVEKYGVDITTIKTEADLEPWLKIVKEGEGANFYPWLTAGSWVQPFITIANNVPEAVMYNDAKADGTDDPTIYFFYERPEALEHFALMHSWYKAGYIHPDSYLANYSKDDSLNAGTWFATEMPLKGSTAKSDELMNASGNKDLKIVEFQIQQPRQITTHAGGSMLAIPVTSKDPARAMMYINLMHTDPIMLNTMVWGVENSNYTTVSQGVVKVNQDNNWNGKHAGNWTLGNQFIQWVSDAEDPQKFEKLKAFSATGTPHISLGFRFRPEAVENEVAAVKGIKDGIERSIQTGAVDPAVEIPKMVTNMKAAGMDKMIKEVQDQFAAWLVESKK